MSTFLHTCTFQFKALSADVAIICERTAMAEDCIKIALLGHWVRVMERGCWVVVQQQQLQSMNPWCTEQLCETMPFVEIPDAQQLVLRPTWLDAVDKALARVPVSELPSAPPQPMATDSDSDSDSDDQMTVMDVLANMLAEHMGK